MAKSFYVPGEQRAEAVKALFDAIAPRYDWINDVQSIGLHRLWKRRLVRLAAVSATTCALDVCCGTGDLALAMAAGGAQVVGVDFSARMLAAARARTPLDIANRAQFVLGDALHLPFPDADFDVVTVGYGLRNLADYTAGLQEWFRVTRPGGRLLILDFGKPENRLWRKLYFTYLKTVVPMYGLWWCGDAAAYRYILESLQSYPAQQGVTGLMQKTGWRSIQLFNFLGGIMSIHVGNKFTSLDT